MEKRNIVEEKKKSSNAKETIRSKLRTFLIAMLFFGCIIACLFFTKNVWLILTISIILAFIVSAISKEVI